MESGTCGAVSWQERERGRESSRVEGSGTWLPKDPHLCLIKGYIGTQQNTAQHIYSERKWGGLSS